MNTTPHTDIKTEHWVVRFLPAKARPYALLMRLDRPVGIWLLLLPALWSIVLAGGMYDFKTIGLFAIGAVVMRGAGCVINDLWDADLDAKVERTYKRPIASGDISKKQAVSFLLFLLCLGLLILLQFNVLTVVLGFVVVPLIGLYPLMKRITFWPQAFLGLVFNFGALMGWSAVTGSLSVEPVMLYLSCIFWTLGYDTIYAAQDMEDDALVGVKSTALRFGKFLKYWVSVFFSIHAILLFFVLNITYAVQATMAYLPVACYLFWQVFKLDTADPQSALNRFKANQIYGILVLFVMISVHYVL